MRLAKIDCHWNDYQGIKQYRATALKNPNCYIIALECS